MREEAMLSNRGLVWFGLLASAGFGVALAKGGTEGWQNWSPRPEIAPRFYVDPAGGRSGGEALVIAANKNPAAFGAWKKLIDGIVAGRTYRFSGYYRLEGISDARRHVSARLEWQDAKGQRARPPDFARESARAGEWTKVEYLADAPENASRLLIILSFGWTSAGSVRWDNVQVVQDRSPQERVVRAITIYQRPSGTKSSAESVEQFCRIAESAAARKPDIVCLPEGITVIGTGKSYADVSESVPGPTTARLAALSKKLGAYVVAGLYEREGSVIYNTAVLIGRNGDLAGKYRKTHLPYEEFEAGLTPGDSYPV